ncbi:MAG: J domain-containing protein [Proteobacteria bacterium]|nr:J domain-containing protein [Pseudomonadota bacterium]
MKHDRFHGRVSGVQRHCDWPGCPEPGEFRAPGPRAPGFDGPGDYRWFCLDHIREFNAGYDWFEGMSAEEILQAQSPIHGWDRQTRAFSPTAGIDAAPRWADYSDPLEAISQRARARRPAERKDGRAVLPEERRALDVLGLPLDASLHDLRSRHSQLVRKYHPDRNGGDRSHEARLQEVVEAYQLLRKSAAFSSPPRTTP